MELTEEVKAKIDAMDYRALLIGWRFTPIGDLMFDGPSGSYWAKRMVELRNAHPNASDVSKEVGWGNV